MAEHSFLFGAETIVAAQRHSSKSSVQKYDTARYELLPIGDMADRGRGRRRCPVPVRAGRAQAHVSLDRAVHAVHAGGVARQARRVEEVASR